MILTKEQYQKTGGYIAWHGYQSFKPNEVTPEQCHEIGLKLAREMWGGKYQIIVATHLDKGHLHNHFCFNSVSYLDGSKYCRRYSQGCSNAASADGACRRQTQRTSHGITAAHSIPHMGKKRVPCISSLTICSMLLSSDGCSTG